MILNRTSFWPAVALALALTSSIVVVVADHYEPCSWQPSIDELKKAGSLWETFCTALLQKDNTYVCQLGKRTAKVADWGKFRAKTLEFAKPCGTNGFVSNSDARCSDGKDRVQGWAVCTCPESDYSQSCTITHCYAYNARDDCAMPFDKPPGKLQVWNQNLSK